MKVLIFAAVMAVTTGAFAEMKFGSVDMLLLVRNHPNYDSNKTLLTSTDKDYQKKLDAIKAEGEAMQEEYKGLMDQMRNPMLIAKAKAEIEGKLTDIQKKLMGVEQRYRAEAMRCRQDLQDLETRLLKTTTDDIRKRLAKFGEKNGYDFIFDSSAAPFVKPEYDVTDEMLKGLGVNPADAKGRDEGK